MFWTHFAPEDGHKKRPKHVEQYCSYKQTYCQAASCWFFLYKLMIWKLSGTDRTAQKMQAHFMDVTTGLCAFGKVLFGHLFNTHFIDQI